MGFGKAKRSPVEKELQKIEWEEQKLLRCAQQRQTPRWKSELEHRIPEKVMNGLQKAFSTAFSLIFEKGAAVIEKTYDRDALEKEFQINDYAVDLKGGRKELGRIRSGAFGSNALNTVVTTVEGVGLGVLGVGLPDIAIWVGVLLRGVYETALRYGFDYESPGEKLLILKMIEAAMTSGADWAVLNQEVDAYFGQTVYEIPDHDRLRAQIEKTAHTFAAELLAAKFVQGLPVIGILGGAVNPVYYQKIMRYVQLKYRKRYLLRKKR
ncbi:EcsC family protein [Butyricicoccus pullicaecorum]|nr:EcsC family protein [Butyricicoccus pullicaecorum]